MPGFIGEGYIGEIKVGDGQTNFSDTLALTSLTSTPKLNKVVNLSDTLALTSSTSTPKLTKTAIFSNLYFPNSYTLTIAKYAGGWENIFTSDDNRVEFTEETGNILDMYLSFPNIIDNVYYNFVLEGYIISDNERTLSIHIWNYDGSIWEEFNNLPYGISDQVLSFPYRFSASQVSSGIVKIRFYQDTSDNSRLYIDKIYLSLAEKLTSLTSTPKLTKQFNYADTLSLSSLTSTPGLYVFTTKTFSDTLALSTLTSNPKLNKQVDCADVLALSSLTGEPKLTLSKNFADTLALSTLTSTPILSVTTLKSFSDQLALSSLTSTPKLFRDVTFSDTLGLSSLTSNPKLFRNISFADLLELTSLTSTPILTAGGGIVNFSDILNLTSLTSNPKLFRLAEFGDILVLTSLTNNPELKIAGLNNFSDILNLNSLTSTPSLKILVEQGSEGIPGVLVLHDGTLVIGGFIKI
jgi:hypothetical protein